LKWQACPLDHGIERAFLFCGLDATMAGKKPAEPTPESVARANRQRLAAEEGARALLDFEQKSVAIRKNMDRLRALREAKQIEDANNPPAAPAPKKRKVPATKAAPKKAAPKKAAANKDAGNSEASSPDAAK
jgi:hypothetical protein